MIVPVTVVDETFNIHIHDEDELLSNGIRWHGYHSRSDLVVFKHFLKFGDYFLDAGANIGWHTVFASKIVGDTGKVFAFEPDEKNYELLLKNIELNNLYNVMPVQAALSDYTGVAELSHCDSNFGDHIISSSLANRTQVACTTLDDWFSNTGIDQSKITLMKFDIQGYEPYALQGMKRFMKYYKPPVILEYSPIHLKLCEASPFDILGFIDKYEYLPFNLKEEDTLNINNILERVSINQIMSYTEEVLTNPQHQRANARGLDFLLLHRDYNIS